MQLHCGVLVRCFHSGLIGGLPFVARVAFLACIGGLAFVVCAFGGFLLWLWIASACPTIASLCNKDVLWLLSAYALPAYIKQHTIHVTALERPPQQHTGKHPSPVYTHLTTYSSQLNCPPRIHSFFATGAPTTQSPSASHACMRRSVTNQRACADTGLFAHAYVHPTVEPRSRISYHNSSTHAPIRGTHHESPSINK